MDGTRDRAGEGAAAARRVEENLVLSCAAERLYGAGGFPGEAALLARLSGRVSDRSHVVGTLFPGFPAAAGARPPLFGGSPAFRAAQGARLCAPRPPGPPTLLIESRDIRLAGNALFYVADGRPNVLFESFRPQDRHVVAGPGPDFEAVDEDWPGDGLTFLLDSAGSFNYGHWLIDDLPRLRALALLRRRHPGAPVTVALVSYTPHIDEARRRSVALFVGAGRGVTVRFLDRAKTHRFARLHHATPSGLPNERKSPDALRFLGTHVRRRLRGPLLWAAARRLGRPGGGRLFVDRHPARGRALTNRAAVLDLMRGLGFAIYDPEMDGVRGQALRFAQARLVVGIAGAGMANTVFCAPRTPVIHLVPEGWADTFYAEIAAACGQPYHAVYGPRVPAERPEHLHDFSLDPVDLRAALHAVGV